MNSICPSVILRFGSPGLRPLAEKMTCASVTERIEDFYKRLNRIYAMTKVLRTGDEMTPIQKEEEEYLRKLGGDEHVVKYSEGYMEGDKLVVTSGPLKDFEGKVKKILRHKRLVVMEVSLLGQTLEVTLGLGVVERR